MFVPYIFVPIIFFIVFARLANRITLLDEPMVMPWGCSGDVVGRLLKRGVDD